ncbi:MAG: DUF3604 domain-containing protein [Planctomycetota bacterium]|nr:MAG: DUF3604 domain-containing protein [Planctomycetota bacterium]
MAVRFEDRDGDRAPSAGDALRLRFDEPVDVSRLRPDAIVLGAAGDTLGQGPVVQPGPGDDEATVVLGPGTALSLYDTYRPGTPQAGTQAHLWIDLQRQPDAVRDRQGRPARPGAPRLIAVPRAERDRAQGQQDRGGPYHPYYGQMHSHTLFSDGTMGYPSDAFDMARFQGGLDWFMTSDHLETLAVLGSYTWPETLRMADLRNVPGEFVTFVGYEWGSGLKSLVPLTLYQHANVMSRTRIAVSDGTTLRGFYEAVSRLPDDPIGKFNHPGSRTKARLGITVYFNNWDDHAYDPLGDKYFCLVRVMYGHHDHTKGYEPLLDHGWHVAPAYGEDNHRGNWGLSDRRMGVWAEQLTRASLREGMRAMRTFTTNDRNAWIRLQAIDSEGPIWMGSTIVEPGPVQLEVACEDADDGFDRIEIVTTGGQVVATHPLNGALSAVEREVVDPPADAWYYARAIQRDGNILYSAPIFVDR